jgi:2-methylcitrate dehydratase PrpD
MKMAILDTLGCIILGSTTHAGKILMDLVKQLGEKKESTIVATRIKTSSPYAALVNGAMGHEFDYDDGVSTALGMHPGISIIPAALAIGEREQVTGRDFITSIVAGYELACRVGRAIERVPHVPTIIASLGATVASGKLLKLNSNKMINAIGICGSLAPMYSFDSALEGVMVKNLGAGWSNFFGMLCVLLAKQGFTGPKNILEPDGAFYKVVIHTGKVNEQVLTKNLGKEFMWMEGHYFKPYSACRGTHVALDAVLKLTKQQKLGNFDQIDEILVMGRPIVSVLKGKFNPISARFSIPYVIATAIKYGRLGIDEFNEDMLKDPTINELAKKVKTFIDPNIPEWPHAHGPVRLVIIFKDGTQLSTYSKEDRSLDEKEVIDKFHDNASRVFNKKKIIDITDIVNKLEMVIDLKSLTAALSR